MELKCKMCGEPLYPEDGQTVVVCDFCGSEQTVPVAQDPHKIAMFNEANNYRMQNRFDLASNLYQHIVEEYPDENEAYWCLVLCRYGIEYVDDPKEGRKIPTCHRTVRESIFDCVEYKKAIANVGEDVRKSYENEATAIDAMQKEILSAVDKEEPYDVFICYKETDNNGQRTLDSQYGGKIHSSLTQKGYKVFFSRVTLKDKVGSKYEPIIYSALTSAKVMLVLGSCSEYMEAPWVRNEWSRYLEFMEQDSRKSIMPCYITMNPYEMPDEFNAYQASNMGELDFLENLERLIDNKFGRSSAPSNAKSAKDDNKKAINRIKIKIMDGDYDTALEEVNALLEDDLESSELLELKLRAVLRGEEKANNVAKNVYKNLIKYAPEEEKAELERKYAFVNKEESPAPTSYNLRENNACVEPQPVQQPYYEVESQPTRRAPIGPRIEFNPSQQKQTSAREASVTDFDAMFANAGFNDAPKQAEPSADMIYDKGEKHYQNGEYFQAINYFKKAAQAGDVNAQIRLADCYRYGKGVLMDSYEAFRRYKEIAELGNREAQNKLAICYDDGIGCPKDHQKAFEWYKKSAENGHMYAQRNLAECYKSGKGTRKNPAEMIKWLTRSANQGDDSAQNSLGYCYEMGYDVPQNYDEAYKWYKKSAEQGNKLAQCNMGLMNYYAKNPSRVQDCKESAYWYEKAAENGHAISQYNLSALYKSGRINGVKDMNKFVFWLKKSAIQGYVIAQFKLGLAYEKGEGVRIDKDAALYWYTKAATQNYDDAKVALARIR